MDLNVVILNWNAQADTLACLEQLAGWTRLAPRIWVVDNGSDPDESAALAAASPRATVLRSERNLGFAGGTNLGLRAALEASDAPVLLLNNDVVLEEASAEALLGTLAAEATCAVAGPVICRASPPQTILSAGSRSPVRHRDAAITRPPADRETYPVEFVSGAAAVLRAPVLREIGLLDEAYFFGLELADLCRRARERGHRVLVNAAARALHDVDRASAYRETLYVYYVVRNRLLYARRFHRVTWPLLAAAWAAHGLQQALRLWLKRRRGTATAIFLGVRDGLAGRFGDRNRGVLRLTCAHPNAAGAPS